MANQNDFDDSRNMLMDLTGRDARSFGSTQPASVCEACGQPVSRQPPQHPSPRQGFQDATPPRIDQVNAALDVAAYDTPTTSPTNSRPIDPPPIHYSTNGPSPVAPAPAANPVNFSDAFSPIDVRAESFNPQRQYSAPSPQPAASPSPRPLDRTADAIRHTQASELRPPASPPAPAPVNRESTAMSPRSQPIAIPDADPVDVDDDRPSDTPTTLPQPTKATRADWDSLSLLPVDPDVPNVAAPTTRDLPAAAAPAFTDMPEAASTVNPVASPAAAPPRPVIDSIDPAPLATPEQPRADAYSTPSPNQEDEVVQTAFEAVEAMSQASYQLISLLQRVTAEFSGMQQTVAALNDRMDQDGKHAL